MCSLQPPRHISTLPKAAIQGMSPKWRDGPFADTFGTSLDQVSVGKGSPFLPFGTRPIEPRYTVVKKPRIIGFVLLALRRAAGYGCGECR